MPNGALEGVTFCMSKTREIATVVPPGDPASAAVGPPVCDCSKSSRSPPMIEFAAILSRLLLICSKPVVGDCWPRIVGLPPSSRSRLVPSLNPRFSRTDNASPAACAQPVQNFSEPDRYNEVERGGAGGGKQHVAVRQLCAPCRSAAAAYAAWVACCALPRGVFPVATTPSSSSSRSCTSTTR